MRSLPLTEATPISLLADASIGQPTWSWVLANGLTGANATQNASLTGVTDQQNLKKFAFNTSANATISAMTSNNTTFGLPIPGVSSQNGINYLTLTYVKRKNSPTVAYIPEFAWNIGSPFVPATAENSVTTSASIDSIWERVTVTDNAPNSGVTGPLSRFGRVRLFCEYWTPQNP